MIALFVVLLYLGHFALVGLVFGLHLWIFIELRELRDKTIFSNLKEKTKKKFVPFVIDWVFFFASAFYVYGRLFIVRFQSFFVSSNSQLLSFLALRHGLLSFAFYITAFVLFVTSLQKGLYKIQFYQLAWTIMILHLTMFQSSFYLNSIFEGMLWFFLPAALVITNDIWAFIFGYFFGRTPLIQLSPKKTWEGFIGGFVASLFFAILFSSWLSRYVWMTCPKDDLGSWAVQCKKADPVFEWTTYTLPTLLQHVLASLGIGWSSISYMPVQLHSLALATFASLICPFGGFFASGCKRALKIKDFGESIPGHGGIADRMDCQMLMGMFVHVYYVNFVRPQQAVLAQLLHAAVLLTDDNKLKLYTALRDHLRELKLLTR